MRSIKGNSLIFGQIEAPRLKSLITDGTFCECTKLIGLEEIAFFFQWSVSKLTRRLEELQNAGVIFKDTHGQPPRKMWCAYPALLLRYVSLKGERREIL
jgi:predicted transcriptional regulator